MAFTATATLVAATHRSAGIGRARSSMHDGAPDVFLRWTGRLIALSAFECAGFYNRSGARRGCAKDFSRSFWPRASKGPVGDLEPKKKGTVALDGSCWEVRVETITWHRSPREGLPAAKS